MIVAEVVKDIIAVLEEGAPRKRIRTHLRESALQNLMAKKPSKLDQLLAVATDKAEEIRANTDQNRMDEEAAFAGFEQNPFRWETRGRQSHVEVGFLWTWQDRCWTLRKKFVFPRLDNVFKRLIPRPPGLDEADDEIYKRLREVASLETKLRKAPCKYLGVQVGQDKYEADPSKWPSRSYQCGKTHATVFYAVSYTHLTLPTNREV